MFTREIVSIMSIFLKKVAISSFIGGKGKVLVGQKVTELEEICMKNKKFHSDVELFV